MLSMTKTCARKSGVRRKHRNVKFIDISRGTYLKSMVSRRNHDIFGLNLFLTDPPFLVAVTGQPANHKNVKSVMCQIYQARYIPFHNLRQYTQINVHFIKMYCTVRSAYGCTEVKAIMT